jgi:hypothetical protein
MPPTQVIDSGIVGILVTVVASHREYVFVRLNLNNGSHVLPDDWASENLKISLVQQLADFIGSTEQLRCFSISCVFLRRVKNGEDTAS